MSRRLIKESDDTMFLPVGKSDAPCGAMCASGTLRIICHCEEQSDVAISRKGHRITKPTQDTFVLAWRKKAQTSKRVSIAACDNAISTAQLSGTPRDTMYPWGEGANKQKSEHYRKRQLYIKSKILAQFRGPHGILVPVGLWTCTFPLFSTYTVFTLEA